jgi:hypothetical protein
LSQKANKKAPPPDSSERTASSILGYQALKENKKFEGDKENWPLFWVYAKVWLTFLKGTRLGSIIGMD